MQNLKADAVLFLTRDEANGLDRAAAKMLAPCEVELRHVQADPPDDPQVDVLIHAHPDCSKEAHASDAAGRIENALRESSDFGVRMMQWVEERATDGPRSGTGAGDGSPSARPVGHANAGLPPKHHRDSQGHGSSQSPAQPGDRQINPPPNPRR